ncbi:hypothetical protein NLJ89_g11446 [Agrocybe chaxingu]|uniref:Uncharacterized protein n=1 Tax=Agrocybe chaxingu TaxID=84603 RepID=A0A9W8JP65_9AGAR|nr:hypothetical protein NLJ89_g11446 [Agrocybe chaxingu]
MKGSSPRLSINYKVCSAAQSSTSAPRPLHCEGAVTLVKTQFGPAFVGKSYAQVELEPFRKPKGVKSTFSHFLHGMPQPQPEATTNTGKGKKRSRGEDSEGDASNEERPRKRIQTLFEVHGLASDEYDSPA